MGDQLPLEPRIFRVVLEDLAPVKTMLDAYEVYVLAWPRTTPQEVNIIAKIHNVPEGAVVLRINSREGCWALVSSLLHYMALVWPKEEGNHETK